MSRQFNVVMSAGLDVLFFDHALSKGDNALLSALDVHRLSLLGEVSLHVLFRDKVCGLIAEKASELDKFDEEDTYKVRFDMNQKYKKVVFDASSLVSDIIKIVSTQQSTVEMVSVIHNLIDSRLFRKYVLFSSLIALSRPGEMQAYTAKERNEKVKVDDALQVLFTHLHRVSYGYSERASEILKAYTKNWSETFISDLCIGFEENLPYPLLTGDEVLLSLAGIEVTEYRKS